MSGERRLAGLDGIRGLAALYVVVHHTFLRSFPGYPVDNAPFWAGWLIYGRFAVVVFIVLSGFSLAVSPARHGWRLGGAARFARRRAWRILPAYAAALVFSVLLAWMLRSPAGVRSVVVHALLLQDVVPATTPNKALWSIAIEAQLYIVFPLLLLLVRRAGAGVMVACVAVPVVVASQLGSVVVIERLVPDLAVLFAIGVLAAGIVAAGDRWRSAPWAWLALVAAVPVLVTVAVRGSVWTIGHLFWVDLALGPAIGCLLAAIATGRPAPLVHTLDTAPLRGLGAFSYSLYLIHYPIVVLVHDHVVAGRVPPGVPSFLASLVIGVPVTLLCARLFAAAFEWPAQRRSARITARIAAPVAAPTTAANDPLAVDSVRDV